MTRTEKEFDYIKIKLASPVRILQWSHRRLPNGQFIGEVQKSETINYRTFKPEMDGLFCERIFGPSKSLECACGKYKRVRYDGLICERCGVELTESRVRRHRMGHINLIYPVTHVWYTNSRPNYMALLLEVEQCEKRIDTGLLYCLPDIFTVINKNLEFTKTPEIKELLEEISKNKELINWISNNTVNKDSILKLKRDNLYSKINRNFYNLERLINDSNLKLNKIKKNLLRLVEIFKKDPSLKLQIYQIFQQEYQKKFAIKSGKVNLRDNRIKRIKLSSLSYFIAEDEISFYGLHWDLQQYRRSRELGFTGYPLKNLNISNDKVTFVGQLIREQIYLAKENNYFKKDDNFDFTLLIIGGSQGAEIFSKTLPQSLNKLFNLNKKIRIFHQVGNKEQELKIDLSYKNNSNVTIFNFEPNIEKYMTLSDLAITRAGSSTLSELAFLEIPFIAIPFKNSLDNHQFFNADYFFRMNACWLIDQQDLSSEKLFDLVTELIRNKEKLLEKKSKLKELSKRDVNEIFEKEINKILA